MEQIGKRTRYSKEVKERAVRLHFEQLASHNSEWACLSSIASKIGCTPETLRAWVRQHERDTGQRGGMTTDDKTRVKEL